MITQARLKEMLSYDESTGVFIWKLNRVGRKAGDAAGSVYSNGYRYIGIDGKRYMAHRLSWLYVHGEFPYIHIDHIDCNTDNNRMNNLRTVSHSQNLQNRKSANSSSGYRGVYWNKAAHKWQVRAGLNGKNHYAGYFSNLIDAVTAAKELRNKLFTHSIER